MISSERDISFPISELQLGNDFSSVKPKILKFLKDADIGISDIHIEERSTDHINFPEDIPEEIKEKLKEALSNRLKSIHHIPETGEHVQFDFMHDESEGTRAMLALSRYWIKAAEAPKVIVIDEIDKSLHPLLVKCLVLMFQQFSHGSQLIFTTHDVQQMDATLFRKDQILLVEKNHKTQATSLYKISDIKGVRKEHVFDRRYMLGAFGALPTLGQFELEATL